jgi:hypothetical protein
MPQKGSAEKAVLTSFVRSSIRPGQLGFYRCVGQRKHHGDRTGPNVETQP